MEKPIEAKKICPKCKGKLKFRYLVGYHCEGAIYDAECEDCHIRCTVIGDDTVIALTDIVPKNEETDEDARGRY